MYNSGVTIWSGTIYLFMHKVGYSYGEINVYLALFWIITFVAEIPSGYIADHFGYLHTIQFSAVIRAIGLLVLTIPFSNLAVLIISGILTALGDSLQSGTMASWIANKVRAENETVELSDIYATYNILSTPVSMVVGFIGANWLGNINLAYPLIAGSLLLLITAITLIFLLKYDSNNLARAREELKKFNLVKDVKSVIKKESTTFKLILLFLPIDFITYSPFTQWQLYFQHGHKIKTGFILVAIDLVGVLGSFAYKRFSKRKVGQLNIIVLAAFLAGIAIILSVSLTNFYYVSILFFLLHIAFYDVRLVAQDTLLQMNINTERSRATIISVNNALEAAVYVVILAINGYISDHFNIGVAWVILALIGMAMFAAALFVYNKSVKHSRDN